MQQNYLWRSPEELVQIGFQRARVVMMNEAYNGLQRCIRTRQIGQRIIPTAHQCGVRYLAIEALDEHMAQLANHRRHLPQTPAGYLAQPEMRSFIQTALNHSWQLIAYESDTIAWLHDHYGVPLDANAEQLAPYLPELQSLRYTNWREAQQAHNLTTALAECSDEARMLVWCGNGHLSRATSNEWVPMGYHFAQHSPVPAFVIDQISTVMFDRQDALYAQTITSSFAEILQAHGGTAGFLAGERPPGVVRFSDADAIIVSLFNAME
ncbi:MAG: hypothetical protein AAGF95_27180 [Chloroflexota bacterium]